jgi:uncharacterized protein (TIGR03067 family)
MRAVLVLVVFAAGGVCAGQDKKAGKESPKLDGEYLIVAMEMEGEKMPDDVLAKWKEADRVIRITGDKMISMRNGKENPAVYTTDATKSPVHLDMVGKKADGTEEKIYGIYKLEDDTLTICIGEVNNPAGRPKEFKTVRGGKAVLMTLKKKPK